MDALAGPLHLVAVVLVVSGVGKLTAPDGAASAMRSAGLPVPHRGGAGAAAGIALGTAEIATGLVVLGIPSPLTAAWMGVVYLALAGFVVVLRRRDPAAACGCFGASSAPPTVAHVVIDLAAAAVAFTAAAVGVPDVLDVADHVGAAVPYVALLGAGAGLVLVAPGLLADLSSAGRGPRRFGPVR